VQKLKGLSADNSQRELSIEKYLVKSEEAFFDRVRKDKLSSAASYISSHRESVWSMPGTVTINDLHSRPTCECTLLGDVNCY
jgi:alpha-1,3-glucan synthase